MASMAIPGSCSSSTPRIQTMRPSSSRTGQSAAAGSRNSQSFKHFLHFARTAGVAQPHPVAWFPVAQLHWPFGGDSLPLSGLFVGGGGEVKAQAEGGGVDLAGNCARVLGGWVWRSGVGVGDRRGSQAEFAMGPLGAEALGEFEFLAGAAGERQGAQGLSGGEVGRGAELRGGVAEQPALQGWVERREPGHVDGERVGQAGHRGPAAAADRKPVMRICGAMRASSACHQASSSRASSAIWARCSRRRGFQPSSSGSSS